MDDIVLELNDSPEHNAALDLLAGICHENETHYHVSDVDLHDSPEHNAAVDLLAGICHENDILNHIPVDSSLLPGATELAFNADTLTVFLPTTPAATATSFDILESDDLWKQAGIKTHCSSEGAVVDSHHDTNRSVDSSVPTDTDKISLNFEEQNDLNHFTNVVDPTSLSLNVFDGLSSSNIASSVPKLERSLSDDNADDEKRLASQPSGLGGTNQTTSENHALNISPVTFNHTDSAIRLDSGQDHQASSSSSYKLLLQQPLVSQSINPGYVAPEAVSLNSGSECFAASSSDLVASVREQRIPPADVLPVFQSDDADDFDCVLPSFVQPVSQTVVLSERVESPQNTSASPPADFENHDAALSVTNEWDQVQCVEPVFEDPNAPSSGVHLPMPLTPCVSYHDVLEYFKQSDVVQEYSSKIQTSAIPHRGGFIRLLQQLCGPPTLNRQLLADRDFVFCLAACPFKDDEIMHVNVLQTIYKKLTGAKFDCPRFGAHWEQIGFQGNNPATDLRSVGFLSLMQLLYIVTDVRYENLVRNIYKLSLHPTQSFPLAVMSINLTKLVLTTLRENRLNRECNRQNSVINVINQFYLGTFHRLYTIWRQEHKTIADSGFVLAELEQYVKKNSSAVVKSAVAVASTPNTAPAAAAADYSNYVELTDEQTLRQSASRLS